VSFSLWKNIQLYDIPMNLLLSLRKIEMVPRQNKESYDPRRIWQVSTGFGNIVCTAVKGK
jgi:hypothetical protein